ncbi:MAG: hypothetical protein KDA64_08955 [Rhodospirillaceae bacterium]|nr:hypothetical protein [Rhodospirillaceae bacterium]
MPEQLTAEQWRERIAKLEAAQDQSLIELDKLEAERGDLALAAADGDAKAETALAKLVARISALECQVENGGLALKAARCRLVEAEKHESEENKRARIEACHKLMRARHEVAKKIDGTLTELSAKWQEFRRLDIESARFEDVVPVASPTIVYTHNGYALRAAVQNVNFDLAQALGVELVGLDRRLPLAASMARWAGPTVLGDLLDPVDAEPEPDDAAELVEADDETAEAGEPAEAAE